MAGAKVLIVDDHPVNLKLARIVLQTAGYDVATAVDAESALAVLGTWSPALILMDLQLPGVDGYELTRRIKADPARAGTAVVALTAYAMKGDEERARAAGCDGYITKPVDAARLLEQVAAFVAAGPAGRS